MALDCNNNLQLELVAEELRLAHVSLVAIMGGDVNEDLLDKIFSDFCIGK
jgi:tRNA U34 5-carboxymethylaminomethyl modifying GTPase MnmE/TrmE